MSIDGRNIEFLDYQQSKISCIKFGKGKQLMIAMHGYGENARSFEVLTTALAKEYLVVAIDLPFHGDTIWREKNFTPEALRDIILLIMEKEGKQHFYLTGFSLGGRLALGLLDYFKEEMRGLWLIAPDGLENRWVDRVMKVPGIIRKLLYRLVQRPQWIIKLAVFLHRMHLVTAFVPKFLRKELSTPAYRERAFGVWSSLDNFRLYRLEQLKSNLIARPIVVELFFGKKDRIIPIHLGQSLSEGADNIVLHNLDGGHYLLNSSLNEYLIKNKKMP